MKVKSAMLKKILSFAVILSVIGTSSNSVFAQTVGYRASNGVYIFPYGNSVVPNLLCASDKACELILAPGETVTGQIAGDTARWDFQVTRDENNAPVIFMKSKITGTSDDPVTTNLFILTDKHTYQVNLESVQSAKNTRYGFMYPKPIMKNIVTIHSPSPLPTPVLGTDSTPAAALDFGYHINGDANFRPVAVWNDGYHTYVKLPPEADAPSMYIVGGDGKLNIINYHPPINDLYTIDGLPQHIALIGSVGKRVPHVDIQKDH